MTLRYGHQNCECDVFFFFLKKKGLWRCNYFKDPEMRSSWVRVDPKWNDKCSQKRKEGKDRNKACKDGCRD